MVGVTFDMLRNTVRCPSPGSLSGGGWCPSAFLAMLGKLDRLAEVLSARMLYRAPTICPLVSTNSFWIMQRSQFYFPFIGGSCPQPFLLGYPNRGFLRPSSLLHLVIGILL